MVSWTWQRVAVVVVALVFVFPFLAMLTTSFKGPDEIFSSPPTLLPDNWSLVNFTEAFRQIPFWRYLINTLVISGLTVLGTIFSCPLVAYALSKIPWWGSKPVMSVVLGSMMLPVQVTMIPVYIMWNHTVFMGSILPLVLPAFFGTPFLIYMIRQFLDNVPNELIEAARIDGASELRIYRSVVLPLAKPALVTAAVFQFVAAWTDFLSPLLYLQNAEQYTLSIGLYSFFTEHGVAWGPLMAACVLFTLPAVAIFLIAQRYFMGGAAAGALK